MLSAAHRLRRSQDFQYVIRRGVRAGRQTLVVHAVTRDPSTGSVDGTTPSGDVLPTAVEPRVGFVVSKAVGNAVTRNRVKRRLRELARAELSAAAGAATPPPGTDVVVRALPSAASSPELVDDFRSAWRGSMKKLTR